MKLLARLYEPTEGRILLDGRDLRDYLLAELRDAVGVIFQDFFRYQLTVKENIAIGRIEDLEVQTKIVDSAEKSLANEVVEGLPGGVRPITGAQVRRGHGFEWWPVAESRPGAGLHAER